MTVASAQPNRAKTAKVCAAKNQPGTKHVKGIFGKTRIDLSVYLTGTINKTQLEM